MIEVDGVGKRFGTHMALRDVSFRAGRGEIVGLLGPNGAGKTTAMRIVTTVVAPDTGSARVAGHDVLAAPERVRERVGYLPERPAVLSDHTVAESLRFAGRIRGMHGRRLRDAIERTVAACGLESCASRLVGNLSRGYRQRVGLAQALLHDPEVLVLDEPTSGLDPAQVRDVRALVRRLAGSRTVLLSTHVLAEVVVVCSSIVIVHEGRVVGEGPLSRFARDGVGLEEAYLRLTAGRAATGGSEVEA